MCGMQLIYDHCSTEAQVLFFFFIIIFFQYSHSKNQKNKSTVILSQKFSKMSQAQSLLLEIRLLHNICGGTVYSPFC